MGGRYKTRTGPEMGVATNDVAVVTAKQCSRSDTPRPLAWRRSRHNRPSERIKGLNLILQ